MAPAVAACHLSVAPITDALTERLEKLEREKEHVLSNLEEAEPDPVRIHPNAADLYIAKVGNLRQ